MNDVVLEFSDSMEQMYIHLLLLVWPTGGASEPAVSVNRGSVGVSSTVIWNPGGAEQQAAQKVILAKNEVKIWIQQMETQKTNDTVNKKENKCSDWQLCLSPRISTASGRPKREFKPKSIRSSIETLDNNQHNGLTHSSSIRSTGTALTHTVTVFITSVFLFSFFYPDFSSHRHPLSFLLSLTDIQINNTVNGKSRYLFMK